MQRERMKRHLHRGRKTRVYNVQGVDVLVYGPNRVPNADASARYF